MASKAEAFTFAELQMVTSLGRGEVRECVRRGIISAPAGVGQGNHRAYSKWNLVQGVIAAALLRHVRAGSVEQLMKRLQLTLLASRINPEAYCATPERFEFGGFTVHFPPRANVDVFVPAALGAVLNDATIPGLRCRVVCGGANNQLAEARHDAALAVRGIVFVPDYLANAGGVIDFHQETIDDQPAAVLASVARIGAITRGVLRCAAATGATPLSVADDIVRARIIRRA